MIRTALALHLFHADAAIGLLRRIARISTPVSLFATHVGPLPPAIRRALDQLPHPIELLDVPNEGWDVGPLFHLLPRLAAGQFELICKLHTKDTRTAAGQRWQHLAQEGTIASDALVAAVQARFEGSPDLALLGPRTLYRSVAAHLLRNDALLSDMAQRLMRPSYPPSDWGFFAGAFFWARRTLLEAVAPLAGTQLPSDVRVRDGTPAHAMERLFGLAATRCGGTIGLVEQGRIDLVPATAMPPHNSVLDVLLAGPAEADWSNGGGAALTAQRNPLVDYIRHGRDADALDPTPWFSSRWYNAIHADVRAAGLLPLEHYVRSGAAEGRSVAGVAHGNPLIDYIRHGRDADALDPTPHFNSRYYNSVHRDVFDAGFHPLAHYVRHGAAEGRLTTPDAGPLSGAIGRPDTDKPQHRFYPSFDLRREQEFLRAIRDLPAEHHAHARETLVSVIMPVFNGAGRIGIAIRSVLAQTHRNFELLIVDDGSTDNTAEIAASFGGDARVRLVCGRHRGVCAARNSALDASQGAIIAYLDCDNRWKPWFLAVMTAWMTAEALDIGYCGAALRDEGEQLTGYRGSEFDWTSCFAENYVDLNTLCHRRSLLEQLGGFDAALRRMVDWDLILRYGRGRQVGYAPFVGCEYFDGKTGAGRISLREPAAFQALVRAKHRSDPDNAHPGPAQVRLAFAIKIAAPEAEQQAWGDYHFAEGLKAALERLGHSARIDFRDRWYGHHFTTEDVVIVLHGLIAYQPQPGRMCFLWVISHPDQVGWAEYDRYTRIYAASASLAALLRTVVAPPVTPLLQATDPSRFYPPDLVPDGPELLFVGNARGVDRDMVCWAIEARYSPDVYGEGWFGRVPPGLVKAANADNRTLGTLYASAGVVLNDHWPAMRAFGLLSNRLFDVVASGGRAISDSVPSLKTVFGDAVRTATGPAELARQIDALRCTPPDRARLRDLARQIHVDHSFDARARVLVRDALTTLGCDVPPTPAPARARLHVHVIAPHSAAGPQSSAYIRLIAPLTDDEVASRIALSIGPAEQALPTCDVCIVQRTALPDVAAADGLIDRLRTRGVALVTDVDDAFTLMDRQHPQHDVYAHLGPALDRLITASAETWFSTAALAQAYAGVTDRAAVIPNGIDPRLWRNWRQARVAPFTTGRVRMLYMGTSTHGPDFALVRPALERLWDAHRDAFSVTLIGVAVDVAPAPWLSRLGPPAASVAYPRFARWLREQGPFDLGLAPMADTAFNRCKSDIKCLDYAALGLLPVLADTPAYRTDANLARFALFAGDGESWFQTLDGILQHQNDAADRAASLQDYVWDARSTPAIARQLLHRIEALQQLSVRH